MNIDGWNGIISPNILGGSPMICKTSFSFKKAIIVNEKMLREVEKLMLEYYSDISYSVKLENRDDIKFESLDELISFENSKFNRISELHIDGRDKKYTNETKISIGLDPIWDRKYGDTIKVDITADDLNKKTILKENLENIFARNEQGKWYNFIAKSRLLFIMQFVSLIVICIFIYTFLTNGFEVRNKALFVSTIISVFISWGSTFFEKMQRNYFPQVTFYLGDGIQDYNKKESGRGNFFWGVVVALGVSFICYIASIIWELI